MSETKRTFLVCKSRNCTEAKRSKVRCTLSVFTHSQEETLGEILNRRNFCVLYTLPVMLESANTPNWVITPDKPGLRKRTQKANEFMTSLANDPDFLEI